jgi:hypothetical protein
MRNDAKISTPDWDSALEFIVENVPRSELIEMYYWVQEPDLLRLIRALAGAPLETRQALDAFFDSARHSQQEVRAGSDDGEDLTLRRDETAPASIVRH